jgi:hypothetical protein
MFRKIAPTVTSDAPALTRIEIFLEAKNFLAAEILFKRTEESKKLEQSAIISCYAAFWQIPKLSYLENYFEDRFPNDKKALRREIWNEIIKYLAACVEKTPSRLKNSLFLSGFNITNNFLYNYFSSLPESLRTAIHRLDLSHNRLTGKQVSSLLTLAPALKTLNLSHNIWFGFKRWYYYSGAQHFALALAKNDTLEELDLTNTGLNDADIKMLAEALKTNTTLRVLNISQNPALTNDIGKYIETIAVKRKHAFLEIIMENNPGLSSNLRKRCRQIGRLPKEDVKPSSASIAVTLQPAVASLDVQEIPAAVSVEATLKTLIENVDKIVEALLQTAKNLLADQSHYQQLALCHQLENIVQPISFWWNDARKVLKNQNNVEKIVNELDKIIYYFHFIYINKSSLTVGNKQIKMMLDLINTALKDALNTFEEKYNEHYWKQPDQEKHKQVLNIVKDRLHHVFQYYKTFARNHATGLVERKNISTGEKVVALIKSITPIISAIYKTLADEKSPSQVSFANTAAHKTLNFVKQSPTTQGVLGLVAAISAIGGFIFRREMQELPGYFEDTYEFLQSKLQDLLGTTEIERRLKLIALNFNGPEGHGKPERLAEAFTHAYRDIILTLTPRDAESFATVVSMHASVFLLGSDSKKHTEQDLLNWMTQASMAFVSAVKSSGSLIGVDELIRGAGFKCRDAIGNEVTFDLEWQIDHHLGGKHAYWHKTNSKIYGYCFADQGLLDALWELINLHGNEILPGSEITFRQFRISGDTLLELCKLHGPFKCVSSGFLSMKERLVKAEDKIFELSLTTNSTINELKKELHKAFRQIKLLEGTIARLEGVPVAIGEAAPQQRGAAQAEAEVVPNHAVPAANEILQHQNVQPPINGQLDGEGQVNPAPNVAPEALNQDNPHPATVEALPRPHIERLAPLRQGFFNDRVRSKSDPAKYTKPSSSVNLVKQTNKL